MDSVATSTTKSRLALRLFLKAFEVLLYVAFFLASLGLGAILHLDLPVSRRGAGDILEKYLSSSFRGSFHVGALAELDGAKATVEQFEAIDPSGRRTLMAGRVSVRVDVLDILKRLVSGHDKISIEIDHVSVDECEVLLHTTDELDAEGRKQTYPSIADAFRPKQEKKSKGSSPGRPVRVWFPDVQLRDVHVRGNLGKSAFIETRVKRANAKLLVTDKGVSIDVDRFLLNASGLAGADALAYGEVHIRVPGAIYGNVSGRVGKVPVTQTFRFESSNVEVKGQFPAVRPAAARPLVPGWPLDRTISIDNLVTGTLEELKVALSVRHPSDDPSQLPAFHVTGTVRPGSPLTSDLVVLTHQLNLQGYLSTLPQSRLDSSSKVHFELHDSSPRVSVETKIEPGSLSGEPTPQVDAVGNWLPGEFTADAHLQEEGVLARVHAAQKAHGPVTYRLDLEELDVRKSERARTHLPNLSGRVRGTVEGKITSENVTTDAHLRVGGLSYEDFTISSARVDAQATIPLEQPLGAVADVDVQAHDADLGGAQFKSIRFTSRGKVATPHWEVKALTHDDLKLQARVDANIAGQKLDNLSAELTGRGKPIEVEVRSISLANSRVRVDRFALRSIGEIHGDLDWGQGGGSIDVEAHKLSVSRIFESLGFPRNEFGGELDGKIDLRVGQNQGGIFEFDVQNGAYQGISGLSFSARGTLAGRETQGTIRGSLQGIGGFESTWDATLGGSPLDVAGYRNATGNLHLDMDHLDLQGLAPLLGASGIKMLTGKVTGKVDLERPTPARSPGIDAHIMTHNLGARLEIDEEEYVITGVDFDVAASSNVGADLMAAAVRVVDDHGTLLSCSGTLDLPLNDWSQTIPPLSEIIDETKASPVELVVVIPRRNITRWPAFVPRPIERGSIGARLALTGTLLAPKFGVVLNGRALDGTNSPFSGPMDVDFNGRYEAQSGSLRGNATFLKQGSRLASAQVNLVVLEEHLTKAPPEGVPLYTGTMEFQLDSTPLDTFRLLETKDVGGVVQGAVYLQRTSYVPQFGAEVTLRDMRFGEHLLGDALLEAKTDGTELVARAQFDDDYGNLLATAELELEPTAAFVRLSETRPIPVTLDVVRYDAVVLLPAVTSVFDELSGPLSGRLRATWFPPASEGEEWTTDLSGNLKMTEGTMTPSALGMRLESVRFSMTANKEGEYNVIRLKNVAAKADSIRHNLTAEAELYFKNLDLTRGTFSISPDEVPFKADGAEFAVLTGRAEGRFERRNDEMRILVGIDKLTAELPPVADTNLILLSENESIQILQNEKPQDTAKDERPLVVVTKVRLGEDVRVKSETLDLHVRGEAEARLADELVMSGGLDLVSGGAIDVLGRRFVIERGVLQFDPADPGNPHLSAVATWRAPNGVLVRVNAEGSASKPLLSFTSEPPLPGGEPAIISLIIGAGEGAESSGTAVASMLANEAVGKTKLSGVSLYAIQETQGGDGRLQSLNQSTWSSYTAAFPISDELWFEGSYSNEQSSGPQSGRAQGGVSGTLDWRFHPNWSLQTEIGQLGTGLDLVWKYRY